MTNYTKTFQARMDTGFAPYGMDMPYRVIAYNNPIILKDLDGHEPGDWGSYDYGYYDYSWLYEDTYTQTNYVEVNNNNWGFGFSSNTGNYVDLSNSSSSILFSGNSSSVFYDSNGSLQRNYDIFLLGRVTYAEAAGQYNIPYAMEGVASTVSNRVNSNKSYFGGNTYEEVIYSGQYASVGCETCYRWNEFVNPDSLKGSASAGYSRSLEVAEGVYSGTIPDPTNGALYFHSGAKPDSFSWFKSSLSAGTIQQTDPPQFGPFWFFK
jgi:hypothetical protein